MNATEKHINDVGNLAWIYQNAVYYGLYIWEPTATGLKQKVLNDLRTIGNTRQKEGKQPVLVMVDKPEVRQLVEAIRRLQNWKLIVLGAPGLLVEKPDTVIFNTCQYLLSYGSIPDGFTGWLYGKEDGPTLLKRVLHKPTKVRQRLVIDTNPYSEYWVDVNRLKHWYPNNTTGLPIRDQVDMRPKFSV